MSFFTIRDSNCHPDVDLDDADSTGKSIENTENVAQYHSLHKKIIALIIIFEKDRHGKNFKPYKSYLFIRVRGVILCLPVFSHTEPLLYIDRLAPIICLPGKGEVVKCIFQEQVKQDTNFFFPLLLSSFVLSTKAVNIIFLQYKSKFCFRR